MVGDSVGIVAGGRNRVADGLERSDGSSRQRVEDLPVRPAGPGLAVHRFAGVLREEPAEGEDDVVAAGLVDDDEAVHRPAPPVPRGHEPIEPIACELAPGAPCRQERAHGRHDLPEPVGGFVGRLGVPDADRVDADVLQRDDAAGRAGGERTQMTLRHAMLAFRPRRLQGPEVFIAAPDKEFDAEGRLVNERPVKLLTELMGDLRQAAG